MGTAAASAGAAGPSEGLRAGRSSGRTKPEYTAASGPRDWEQADDRDSEPDYLLRPTRHGPGGKLLSIAHSFLAHKSPFRRSRLGFEAILEEAQRHLWEDPLRLNQSFKGTVASAADLRHYPHSVCGILVLFSSREEV